MCVRLHSPRVPRRTGEARRSAVVARHPPPGAASAAHQRASRRSVPAGSRSCSLGQVWCVQAVRRAQARSYIIRVTGPGITGASLEVKKYGKKGHAHRHACTRMRARPGIGSVAARTGRSRGTPRGHAPLAEPPAARCFRPPLRLPFARRCRMRCQRRWASAAVAAATRSR